ncbi:MAG: family 43 glycosylhydrolase, partial [Solobacterium sp.]|nr:family 43 glycosylhydrolase [Solobacterium sp.]
TLEYESVTGIGGSAAYSISEETPIQINSGLLDTQSAFTLSFWINPSDNWTDSVIFSYANEDGDYFQLLNSGTNADGSMHGLTLDYKLGKDETWIVADSNTDTIQTCKWNYITVSVSQKNVDVLLNGVSVASGTIPKEVKQIKHASLSFGSADSSVSGLLQGLNIQPTAYTADEAVAQYRELYPQTLLDALSFADTEDVQDDFWLAPELGDESFPVTWTSSDPAIEIVRNSGTIQPESDDRNVTLTASLTAYGRTYTKDYSFTVRADSDATAVWRDSLALDQEYDHLINADTDLPSTGNNGSTITWSTDANPDCTIENNRITRTSDTDKPAVNIHIQIQKGDSTASLDKQLVVLDAYAGYILSYFNGNSGSEAGRLAYSTDGLHWTALENSTLFDTNGLGTGSVRDPYIGRDADGNFIMISTEGYDNPNIYVWHSNDLITADDVSLESIAATDTGNHESGTRAWAPEYTYLSSDGLYYIYFSDPTNDQGTSGYIYYVTTEDFKTFSYPKVLFGPGYTVIDATITANNGKYWMFYKDERTGASTIYYASSDHLTDGFSTAYDENFISLHKFIEGPFLLKSFDSDSYYLYVDNYPYNQFLVASFTTLGKTNDITWLNSSDYTLPEEDVRHGSAIAVTQAELNQIIAAAQ